METEEHKSKISNIIFICVFSIGLSLMCAFNLESLYRIAAQQKFSAETWKQTATTIESQWKTQVVGREQLIDLYGISLLTLNKDMIGNFEFVKDSDGIIQRFEAWPNTSGFEESILDLKMRLSSNDTPLIYIQLPNKTEGLALASQFYFSGQRNDELVDNLSKNDVQILDIQSIMQEDPEAPTRDKFFFHTDVHLTTYAEFWMTKYLVKYLSANCQISFPMAEQVLDKNQYEILGYEFLGNTARSAGRYFAGTDCFENYIPLFDTDMTLIDKNGIVTRTGEFQSVVMNGYENREDITDYTYWITNYAQYPEPYYQYQNNLNQNSPKILVIADSLFMRGISFLSLLCSNVTVVDTRQINDTPYVEWALAENNYDAVIICGNSASFLQSEFAVCTVLPDLPELPAQTADYWISTHGICVDTYNGIDIDDANTISIDSENTQIRLVGWTADFNALKPLQALYLQVGDHVIQCEYGIERTSVSNHFRNLDLKNTGFSVTFPLSYLEKGTVDKIQFVQISADGTCCYEPISYQLDYT